MSYSTLVCPGCKKLLLKALNEPPCSVCGWAGTLAEIAKGAEKFQRVGIKFMIVVGLANFGIAMWMATWVFHTAAFHPYELFWTLWFMIGNGAIFAYILWKFKPWRLFSGQKKSG